MFNRLISIIICVLIQACVTTPIGDSWPTELPPRQLFVDACQSDRDTCGSPKEIEQHLLWIKRFYLGSIFYPTGWNEMIELLTTSLENEQDKVTTTKRLESLGLRIVLEWAKDNNTRLINSQHLAIWGRALRASAERNEQIDFIATVEQDVEQVLLGSAKPEEITQERYYPEEDYDNF